MTNEMKEVITMTKYIIAYKDENGKWRTYAIVNNRAQVIQKITDLYNFKGAVEKIQIQKVIK